jgi:putative transposase
MTLQHQVRTIQIELHPTKRQRDLIYQMMRASAKIYNLLVDQLGYKQKHYRELAQAHPGCNPWEIDPYCDIRSKGWADEAAIAFTTRQACVFPQQLINKPAKQGKHKGEDRLVVETEKYEPSDYGIPAQSKGCVCRDFEANITGFFTHRKQGNLKAKLPKRYKGLHTLFFTNQIYKRKGSHLFFGTGPYKLSFKLPEIAHLELDGDAKITRTRGGKFYLSLMQKRTVELNPELTEVAAVDFGQKRAMVLALANGDTAVISGKNILALKRERDRRYRGINRLRASAYRGRLRQYLTPAEQAIAAKDTRYGHRMIAQRRRELGLGKKSKRDRRLLLTQRKASTYYQVRLKYANHTVTRAAVDWCEENKVGKVFVGKLGGLPKGRKRGMRRIKQVARNNQWEMPTQVKYLKEKLTLIGGEGTEETSERFSSQTCPSCGRRHKPRNRNYYCNPKRGGCGWKGDRDAVGATNILSIALTGACGSIKPAHNRTLRLSPAIRQGLRMPTPDGLKPVCEPVEDVAKGHKPSGLQASVNVSTLGVPKTARKPVLDGKTQARGGSEVLAKAQTSNPSSIRDTCSDRANCKTGVKLKGGSGSRIPADQKPTQLSLWSSP